jgi:hypothetical protein
MSRSPSASPMGRRRARRRLNIRTRHPRLRPPLNEARASADRRQGVPIRSRRTGDRPWCSRLGLWVSQFADADRLKRLVDLACNVAHGLLPPRHRAPRSGRGGSWFHRTRCRAIGAGAGCEFQDNTRHPRLRPGVALIDFTVLGHRGSMTWKRRREDAVRHLRDESPGEAGTCPVSRLGHEPGGPDQCGLKPTRRRGLDAARWTLWEP